MDGIIVLGVRENFWSMPGLDCLFLTLSQAEEWGSKPLPPYTCAVLSTPPWRRADGFPPYAVTGMVLKDEDPKDSDFVVPLVIKAAVSAVLDFNRHEGDVIQTVGISGFGRLAPDVNGVRLGELIRHGYQDALGRL